MMTWQSLDWEVLCLAEDTCANKIPFIRQIVNKTPFIRQIVNKTPFIRQIVNKTPFICQSDLKVADSYSRLDIYRCIDMQSSV